MRRFLILIALLIGLMLIVAAVSADDGIPGNCEYANAAYYNPALFPRYEPQNNGRLVLVNWNTGADVQVLGEGLDYTQVINWSISCRYLVTATGNDPYTTIIWDVVNNQQIGSVPDAHGRPHTVTWGPNDYAVVERRTGALLWHVPTNTQTLLTEHYDNISGRNFSRLRWEVSSNQLVANLANGPRIVYDLSTGQEIPLFSDTNNSIPVEDGVILGGKVYRCGALELYPDRNQVVVIKQKVDHPNEVLEVLDDDSDAIWIRSRGWSKGCRYVAASLGIPGRDASNTVVWDMQTKQLVGVFEDARQIVHPLHWDTTGESLIIETRNGGYLWHLPTNSRYLLYGQVETALSGRSSIKNFEQISWNAERGEVAVIPVGKPTDIWIFDARNGTLKAQYQVENPTWWLYDNFAENSSSKLALSDQAIPTFAPVEGITGSGQLDTRGNKSSVEMACGSYAPYLNGKTRQLTVRNLETKVQIVLAEPVEYGSSPVHWSPDCRYLLAGVKFLSKYAPYDDAPLDDQFDYRGIQNIMIWDVETGEVLQHLYAPAYSSTVWWSPGGDRALVKLKNSGIYLWHPASNMFQLLAQREDVEGYISYSYYPQIYWDYERGWIIVGTSYGGPIIFDMTTGIEIYRFGAGQQFSIRDNKLYAGGLGIWDLDTFESVRLIIKSAYVGDRTTLSPDGRYLVMGRSLIRVWDLQNLPEKTFYYKADNPNASYAGPLGLIEHVAFVSDTVIEVTTRGGEISQWNILTGENVE